MNLGLGKAKSLFLLGATLIISTSLGAGGGTVLVQALGDAGEVYLTAAAIGIMFYVAFIELLPELGHFDVTAKQKTINVCLVAAALVAMLLLSVFMGHSHDHEKPKTFYEVWQKPKTP